LSADGDSDSTEEEEKTGWSMSDSWVGSGPR